jgi:hypothetical protein
MPRSAQSRHHDSVPRERLIRIFLSSAIALAACQGGATPPIQERRSALQVVAPSNGESDTAFRRRVAADATGGTLEAFLKQQQQLAPAPHQAAGILAIDAEDHFGIEECRQYAAAHGINQWLWKNHYSACFVATGNYHFSECDRTGCKQVGSIDFRATIIGSAFHRVRSVDWAIILDKWGEPEGTYNPEAPLTVGMICNDFGFSNCDQEPAAGEMRSIAQWQADGLYEQFGSPKFVTAAPGDQHPEEKRSTLGYVGLFAGAPDTSLVPSVAVRCDEAIYMTGMNGFGGCIFTGTPGIFHVDVSNESYRDSALFIQEAFYALDLLKPSALGLFVPGNYRAREAERMALTRNVYGDRSRDAVRAECRRLYGSDYTTNEQCQHPPCDCDEYPFSVTYQNFHYVTEGPAWTSVVKPVNGDENSALGNALNVFLTDDHILDGDPFYVDLGPAGGDPNAAPRVNAGPDVSGDEGSAIALGGTVTDPDSAPATSWRYVAGDDVDSGATCTFGDAHAAGTTITCTDDGTYVVFLTANDGFNHPVSDDAIVHVRNVAPTLLGRRVGPALLAAAVQPEAVAVKLAAPSPWQLFRKGDTVTVTGPYVDPGSNDTQTCKVDWDDGVVDSFAAHDSACSGTHAYQRAGMFTIRAGVTDDDSGADAATVLVIAYDPRAGTASGNGWLIAPGNGGFDFATSYPTVAATVPDGAVTFALPPDPNLNLRNHQHLEWTVITPDGKIAIKGTGERIPGQNVGFVLYGYYGCPAGTSTGCQRGAHRLRMVVWDSTRNGPIPEGVPAIYDNRAGTSFDVDEANPQAINQGIIQIQHPPIQ